MTGVRAGSSASPGVEKKVSRLIEGKENHLRSIDQLRKLFFEKYEMMVQIYRVGQKSFDV